MSDLAELPLERPEPEEWSTDDLMDVAYEAIVETDRTVEDIARELGVTPGAITDAYQRPTGSRVLLARLVELLTDWSVEVQRSGFGAWKKRSF